MHIFRIFFVSTVLIPVLVVVVTSDEAGLRIRKPRSIVISEDGTRAGRRHNPVNISDKSCPSLGCTGNLTTNAYNGKGSLASTMLPRRAEDDESGFPSSLANSERRFGTSLLDDTTPAFQHHHHPLKLQIKLIKNSTRSDIVNYEDFSDEVGTGRGGIIKTAVLISWAVYWSWKVFLGFVIYNVVSYCWNSFRKRYGIGDDYVEYYVKLGKDSQHPFGDYGGGWNPTFGISLKSKVKDTKHGWKVGWPSHHHHNHNHGWKGWSGWPQYAASYHDPHAHGWPQDHHQHSAGHDYGWPPPGKSESEEEEDELKHKFDMKKGWKYAQKYTKKYGKKAHKHGLRPSKYSYMFDKDGNIILGGNSQGVDEVFDMGRKRVC